MLKIRLQRVGRKHIPIFRIVLTDSHNSTKSGKYLEVLGSYDPVHDEKTVKADRVKHWLSVGAQPSGTVRNFLIDKKLLSGKKVNVLPRRRPIVAVAPAGEAAVEKGGAAVDAGKATEAAVKETVEEETKKEEPAAEVAKQ